MEDSSGVRSLVTLVTLVKRREVLVSYTILLVKRRVILVSYAILLVNRRV